MREAATLSQSAGKRVFASKMPIVFTDLTDQQVGWLSRMAGGDGMDRHDEGLADFRGFRSLTAKQ
jgi:hypothetical protein